MEKLILHNKKLIPENCNADDAMSIAGGGKMIFHGEAVTEIEPAKLLLMKQQSSLQTEQQKYWKTHRWINGDMSKASKTQQTLEPEDVHRRLQGFSGAKQSGMAAVERR